MRLFGFLLAICSVFTGSATKYPAPRGDHPTPVYVALKQRNTDRLQALATVTSASLPAAKEFLEGERLLRAGQYREAADVLEIPVGTVKSRLHSALLKLNQAWKSSKL